MEKLVELAKNKDKKAFIELISNIKEEMYLVAKLKLKNEKDIENAIQNTLIKSYKCIKRLHINNLFKIWIMRIHINECDKIKKKNKNKELYKENNSDINKKGKDIKFDILIRNLNDEEKVILTFYYYFKYSIKEVCEIFKEKENIINSKIIRARNKIRKEIKDNRMIDIEKILRISGSNEIYIPSKIEKIVSNLK